MNLYQYIILEEQLQYQIIWEQGVHIDTVHHNGLMYILFAINDFFVELQYSEGTNKIVGKNQFKQGEHIDKYLPDFNPNDI